MLVFIACVGSCCSCEDHSLQRSNIGTAVKSEERQLFTDSSLCYLRRFGGRETMNDLERITRESALSFGA